MQGLRCKTIKRADMFSFVILVVLLYQAHILSEVVKRQFHIC